MGEDFRKVDSGYSKEGLANLIASQTPVDELHHALLAIEIAKCSKIFANHNSQWEVGTDGLVGNATGNDVVNLMQWKGQMKRDVVTQNTDLDIPHAMDID